MPTPLGVFASGQNSVMPTEISGLRAWFRAADVAGADNSSQSSWAKSGGTVGNLGPGSVSASTYPTLQTNEVNGKSVIDFSSANIQRYIASAGTDFNYLHQDSNTSYYVVRPTTLSGNMFLLDSAQGTTASVGVTLQFDISGRLTWQIYRGVGGTSVVNLTTPNNTFVAGVFYIIVCRWANAAAGNSDSQIWVNGISVVTGNTLNTPSGANSSFHPTLGTRSGSPASSLNAAVAEWASWDRALSDDELRDLVGSSVSIYGV